MAPRFRVASVQNARHTDHNIVDLLTQDILATARKAESAEFVTAKLNAQTTLEPEWRALIASCLCDFREHLETENSGPLVDVPDVAFFLKDFCTYFHLNTGETALALGGPLLVYLNGLETDSDSVSIVPVRDLAVGEELRVG